MGESGAAVANPEVPADTLAARSIKKIFKSPFEGSVPYAPIALAVFSFLILFWSPMVTVVGDWWYDPEAGHGLLLGPLALILMWKRGIDRSSRPQPFIGLLLLAA